MSSFNDPNAVANYANGPVRQVPGFVDMQRMAALLLLENLPPDAQVLVHGAGGGLELKLFGEHNPSWRFLGVDPSSEMLDLARKTIGDLVDRVDLHHGYIDTAPTGPFDGATSILTLHFIARDERLRTLQQLRARLKPDAPLIVAHHSIPDDAKELWLNRYAAFATASGVPADAAQNAAKSIAEKLPTLSPADDEALIEQAGFTAPQLFYAGFSFRGWIAFNR